jgi:hypothetical protein
MKNALKITLIIIIGIIAPLFFVGTPLLLGILSRKPLLGAFGVIWGEIGIYGFFVAGILAGAFFVLYRPPSIGESHIEIKNKNRVLYKSPIVFLTLPKMHQIQ